MVDMQFSQKLGCKISDIDPEEAARACRAPALFVHAKDDTVFAPEHTQKNFDAYGSKAGADLSKINKVLRLVEGEHNSQRPEDILTAISRFFKTHLEDPMPSKMAEDEQAGQKSAKSEEITGTSAP